MTMMNLTGLSIEEYVGIETAVFWIDWCNSVGVCLKLKAIPNDDQNGLLEFAVNEKVVERLSKK